MNIETINIVDAFVVKIEADDAGLNKKRFWLKAQPT